jgi:hypothetical protein
VRTSPRVAKCTRDGKQEAGKKARKTGKTSPDSELEGNGATLMPRKERDEVAGWGWDWDQNWGWG